MVGGSTPVLNDPDLQELLELATRLRDELPRDLPDPAFRHDLKRQLTRARIEPLPAAARARPVPPSIVPPRSRVPSFATLSALAAVFVAVVAIGVVGMLLNRDNAPSNNLGVQDVVTGTTVSAVFDSTTSQPELPSGTSGGGIALVTASVGLSDPLVDPTSAFESTGQPGDATEPQAATTPQPPDAPTASATATTTEAAQETPALALGPLPDVAVDTVEQGPTAFAEGGSDGPDERGSVEFVLDTTLPQFASTAPVYRLSPPDVEPSELVADIASRLGISGEINVDEYSDYREFHVTSEDGRYFRWIPETGAFQYGSFENSVVGDLTAEAAVEQVRGWLAETGYPVDRLALTGSAKLFQEGQWEVELALASMPQPGVGHPLGIRAFVNDDGVVLSATGYWLVADESEQATLLTAQECWSKMQTGKGYWRDGGMSSDGGELRVVSLAVSYILTRDENGLVLQPVVQADGDFVGPNGVDESRISVFFQAIRAET